MACRLHVGDASTSIKCGGTSSHRPHADPHATTTSTTGTAGSSIPRMLAGSGSAIVIVRCFRCSNGLPNNRRTEQRRSS